jgi:hypothetical protein
MILEEVRRLGRGDAVGIGVGASDPDARAIVLRMRFRIPELFLGALMTVAVFAMGMMFESSHYQPSNQPTAQTAAKVQTAQKTEPFTLDWLTEDGTVFFTAALVVVACIQAALFVWQLRYMRKGMEDTSAAAIAGRNSADAATGQAKIAEESFSKLERPYLYITDVSAFILDKKSSISDPVFYVTYTVANYGKTPAIIKHAQGICHGIESKIATGPDIPLAFDYDHVMVSSPIIRAGEIRESIREDVAKDSVAFTADEHFFAESIDDCFPNKDADREVFLWIILTYRGPFTDQHEISACWRWDYGSRRFVKHGQNNWEK